MTAPVLNPIAGRVVQLVSGKDVTVQTAQEAEWFTETRDAYLSDLKLTEKTDLIDLDRVLILELMIFRWTQQLAAGEDYDGDMIDAKQMSADLKLYSDQLNKVKETMGLSKKARDASQNEGNFAQWLDDLKARAKIFGIHREKQLTKALALMFELSAIIGTYDRSDAEERRKMGFEKEEDIIAWLRSTMLPEFHALDEYFRAHDQRYWVREM